ncbi:unnamed protein product [Gongylonema pulchrum]|uniref:GPI ethanolamine phosphate transferase 1 n=1 Tax=Gongylonema pulchrum TaxID=637853 RepID=A0A183DAN2_9BILA|nr:unnamed protein product [Gongylonema pulchrum]
MGLVNVDGTTVQDWLQGWILVVLIEAAFFGTGNIASLNSFNPSFLRCFISVFSPFTMTAMLIFKISLPILAVAFAYAVIVRIKNIMINKLSMVLLIITDAMALVIIIGAFLVIYITNRIFSESSRMEWFQVFFFRLVDEGSWQDIGTS